MDKIAGVKAKIERADKHIDELELELIRFQEIHPYKVSSQRDPQTRKLVYYMAEVADVPLTIRLIAGDILQNLRTALDHLAWALVVRRPKNPKSISFPIFDSPESYQSHFTGKVSCFSTAAIEAIDRLKPYRAGNEVLWKISELNNRDKHRLLIAVCASVRSLNFGGHYRIVKHHTPSDPGFTARIFPDFHIRPSAFRALKAGDPIYIDAPDTEVNEKIDFRFNVAFGESGVAEGDSVIEFA